MIVELDRFEQEVRELEKKLDETASAFDVDAMRDELNGADANYLESVVNYAESMGVCLYGEWSEDCQRVSEWEWREE